MTQQVRLSIGRERVATGVNALVDDGDFERVRGRHWRLMFANGRHFYAASGTGILLHRFILDAPADLVVIHGNDDGLDCRRSNLRLVTPSQMEAYRWSRLVSSLPSGKTSKFKGVSFVAGRSRPWRATVSVGSKQNFLGYHESEEEAARAYDQAAQESFGEFARLNFGPELALR